MTSMQTRQTQNHTKQSTQKQLQPLFLKRQIWTPDENIAFKVLVQDKKPGEINWQKVAAVFQNHNARQCRNHYYTVCPKKDWTSEEDNLLIQKYNELGSQWAKIQVFFQDRTHIQIKNRFNLIKHKKNKNKTTVTPADNSDSDSSDWGDFINSSTNVPPASPQEPEQSTIPPTQQLASTTGNAPADNSTSSSDQTNSYFDDLDDVWWKEDDFFQGNNEF